MLGQRSWDDPGARLGGRELLIVQPVLPLAPCPEAEDDAENDRHNGRCAEDHAHNNASNRRALFRVRVRLPLTHVGDRHLPLTTSSAGLARLRDVVRGALVAVGTVALLAGRAPVQAVGVVYVGYLAYTP